MKQMVKEQAYPARHISHASYTVKTMAEITMAGAHVWRWKGKRVSCPVAASERPPQQSNGGLTKKKMGVVAIQRTTKTTIPGVGMFSSIWNA